MSLIGLVKDAYDTVSGVVDRLTGSEKIAAKAEIESKFRALEDAITKRHEIDMASDSWLSKNIRPMVLLFLFVIIVVLAVGDGLIFEIKEGYIELFKVAFWEALGFYFVLRTAEKRKIIK